MSPFHESDQHQQHHQHLLCSLMGCPHACHSRSQTQFFLSAFPFLVLTCVTFHACLWCSCPTLSRVPAVLRFPCMCVCVFCSFVACLLACCFSSHIRLCFFSVFISCLTQPCPPLLPAAP
ncbi:hypothetical protein PTSG_12592 [Salpingoeca rosetta]|uniref:Uncharacterized protein n=1 Tax=Salpingoeca rosetta (strain ATCC 50818 / BSB-021) TaxID=946362 RepID=F2UIV0_SALR5|nr:uncharacterized protein PTSG_12592 [Salpingoeca rosetta]EGD77149.1 hypothetical protein PTSG_12592 [Salpingoeca rosetta]|eukprot:XP_004990988.1 hypothetical protein PTSG_12592 [Salpingoeca rosetta]